MFQSQPTSYAGGVFTKGGLPRYPLSSPMAAYADGALGCGSCQGLGTIQQNIARAAYNILNDPNSSASQQSAALMAAQQATQQSRMWTYGLIGVSVLAAGTIAYFVFKK